MLWGKLRIVLRGMWYRICMLVSGNKGIVVRLVRVKV